MIYLIDDKDLRQKDFGWSAEKFASLSSIIRPLYNIEDIIQIGDDLYIENNIILYHESFLDFTRDKFKALKQREKLTKIAATTPRLSVAFFSGSQVYRMLNGNVASLPVSILYQNLEILIKQHTQGAVELKYLLFGENPEIEEELNEKLTQANRNIEEEPIELNGKTLFLHPDEDFIQNAIMGAQTEEIYNEKDAELTEIVLDLLNENEYDNIFLPLCFGQTLSDFNGLRLAAHIRCTPTKNQLKRIFIYGFVGLDYLLEHEYFNILKTKNIHLVSYSKKAFGYAASTYFDFFKPEELSKEIKKLKLDTPLNYADSHSIANEWAIYRWAKIIGCSENQELKKVFNNVQYNLYFKYLRIIHPISKQDVNSNFKLKIDYEGEPKVLLIDDESEKGWYEIFAFLLGDLNNIYTDYLGEDFKSLSSDEIIKKSIDKIFTDNIDVVFLDFRLNPSDFENKNSQEITSIKLLKEIKKRNPGIQVIIFSATNKILNLQALQEARADAFVLKDSGDKIRFTITKFIEVITLSIKKSNILKPIHCSFNKLEMNGINLNEGFKINLKVNLSICFDLLIRSFENEKFINYAFLQLFLIIEEFIKQNEIFEEGTDCFVRNAFGDVCVAKRIGDSIECALTLTSNGKYEIRKSSFRVSNKFKRFDINFIMSSILIFKYGNKSSSVVNWTKIYKIRNGKAAHFSKEDIDSKVKIEEVSILIEFLKYTLDLSNENSENISKGLILKTIEESINEAKKNNPRFKSKK